MFNSNSDNNGNDKSDNHEDDNDSDEDDDDSDNNNADSNNENDDNNNVRLRSVLQDFFSKKEEKKLIGFQLLLKLRGKKTFEETQVSKKI